MGVGDLAGGLVLLASAGLPGGLSGALLDGGGEPGDRRVLEELPRGDAAARLARPRHHLEREDRVAAQSEEVVVDPHLRQPQDLGPEAGEELLDRAARGAALGRAGARSGRLFGVLKRRQRAQVHLAVARQRQRFEPHDGGRQHRLGERPRQPCPQVGRRSLRGRGDVGDEAPHAVALARHDRRGAHAGAGGEGRLDLPQLDAMAADLDLAVAAAEELQLTVRPPPRQVAGLVEPGSAAGADADTVGQEALGGELQPAEIAAGERRAADVHLPRDAGGDEPSVAVQQVHLEMGERPPDRARRRRQVGTAERPPGGVHRRLGDAVHVDQPRPGLPEAAEPAGEERRIERLAAEDHQPEMRQAVAAGERRGRQLGEGRGGLVQDRHPLGGEEPQELLRRAADRLGHDHQPAAVGERPPDLPDREIEGVGMEEGPDVVRPEAEERTGGGEQARDVAVGDRDPLRATGGSRGIDDVGEMVARGVGAIAGAGAGAGRRRRRRRSLRAALAGVRRHQLRSVRRQAGGELGAGDEQARPGVVDHEAEPLGRIGRIERDVGAARLEHREEGDQEIERALEADRHQRLRAHAPPPQDRGEPPGAPRQLSVGELAAALALAGVARRARRGGERDRVRRPRRLGGEALVEGKAGEIGGRPRVPLGHHLLALRRRQHGEIAEPWAGRSWGRAQRLAQRREEVLPVGEEARRRRGVVVLGVPGQAEFEILSGRRRDRRQRIVRPLAEAHLAERQAAVLRQDRLRVVLEDEEAGGERRARRQLAPAQDPRQRGRLEGLARQLALLEPREPVPHLRQGV